MLTKSSSVLQYIDGLDTVLSDPILNQFITQHLIVLSVAETEDHIESIIINHFKDSSPPSAQNLARNCLSNLLRSIKTSEISGFLNRLGQDHKDRFQTIINTQLDHITRFNNLIVNRHSIVHEAQCNITLDELKTSIPAILFICNAIEEALSTK